MSVCEIVAALKDTEALIKSQLERIESGDGDEGPRRALEVLGSTWDYLIMQLGAAVRL
jgi:hypothetical protein